MPPAGALLEDFKAAVVRMGGKLADAPADGDLDALVRRLFPDAKVICSATPEVSGNLPLDRVRRPAELGDVDVGVVRAVFGVAETGSVWLTEAAVQGQRAWDSCRNILSSCWTRPGSVGNLHHAYRERAQFDVGYGVFMTGPSATADIEGVLIHGAQGIRSLTIVAVAPSQPQARA